MATLVAKWVAWLEPELDKGRLAVVVEEWVVVLVLVCVYSLC